MRSGRVVFGVMEDVVFGVDADTAAYAARCRDRPAQARAAAADIIVTGGGGSVTNGGKAAQMFLANDIHTIDDIDMLRDRDGTAAPMKAPTVRQIRVPTTGSEGDFSISAGVTDQRNRIKERLRNPLAIPRADPRRRSSRRGLLLARSASVRRRASLQWSLHARSGAARLKADLVDIEARTDCQLGAWLSMGALSAGVPIGASQGIGYVRGAVFGVRHGITCCVMLPSVMRWNRSAGPQRQALVAEAMGHPGKVTADVLDRFIRGLPGSLREVHVGSRHFDLIARAADVHAVGIAQSAKDREPETDMRNPASRRLAGQMTDSISCFARTDVRPDAEGLGPDLTSGRRRRTADDLRGALRLLGRAPR